MFNWLKKKSKESLIVTHWHIDDIPGFKKIQSTDSVQYINEDESRIIYFSVLKISGKGPSLLPNTTDPVIKKDDNGWQLKGSKSSENQILVCVISITQEEDLDWAKAFFASIA